jgi:hypothetical protein
MADKEEIKTLEELEEKEEYCGSTKKNSGRCAKKIK